MYFELGYRSLKTVPLTHHRTRSEEMVNPALMVLPRTVYV